MYGVVLVLILIIMGGAIAYIGDKLGSKVGKRKLSIFGLRPKHTSIIVTIITGILITSSTLAIMAITSENVRVALFGMEALNKQIHETEMNLTNVKQDLEIANQQRQQTLDELQKVVADYEAANQDLAKSQAQIEKLEQTKTSLEQAKAELDAKVSTLNEEQALLESDVERLNVLTARLNKGIQFVREGQVVYRAGEIIANAVLPYSEDENQRAKLLSDVMYKANQHVLERLGVKEEIEALWLSQAEFQEALDRLSAQGNKETVVRVIAAGNIIYGEPVRVQVQLYPNHRIYNRDDFVYSEVITVDKDTNAEQLVLDFLAKVNEKAIHKGVLPDPIRRTVGSMSGSQFYDIVNNIEALNGTVEISAYAGDEVNAAGPLRLNIYVKTVQ